MTDHLRQHLEQIPDLYALLGLFVVKGSTGDVVLGSPMGSRPPMDLAVIDLLDTREKPDAEVTRTDAEIDRLAGARRQGVLPTLASWVRLADGELWDFGIEHDAPSETPTVASECAFLVHHIDWIAEQQWVDELADDVRRIRGELRSVTRDRDIEDLHLACTSCGWHDIQSMGNGTWFRCTGCDQTWTEAELSKHAERARPRPLKACAEVHGVSVRTLRRAIERGELKHVAADGSTRLFDPLDVAAVAARDRLTETEGASA